MRALRASGAGHDHTVFSAQLPNVPGKALTAIVVEYGPGGSSPAHRHAGSVLAYVLSGQIRSENSATGPVRVYRVGETFFEPPGSTHLVSANASNAEPASLVAVFVADDHALAAGAHVIASVLPRDRDEALRLGADEVISIPGEEAQGLRGTLDIAIDTVGGKTQRELFAYVRRGGTLISSVSVPDAQLAQQCGIEAKFILVDVNTEDLEAVADLIDAKQLVVRSGRCSR